MSERIVARIAGPIRMATRVCTRPSTVGHIRRAAPSGAPLAAPSQFRSRAPAASRGATGSGAAVRALRAPDEGAEDAPADVLEAGDRVAVRDDAVGVDAHRRAARVRTI